MRVGGSVYIDMDVYCMCMCLDVHTSVRVCVYVCDSRVVGVRGLARGGGTFSQTFKRARHSNRVDVAEKREASSGRGARCRRIRVQRLGHKLGAQVAAADADGHHVGQHLPGGAAQQAAGGTPRGKTRVRMREREREREEEKSEK